MTISGANLRVSHRDVIVCKFGSLLVFPREVSRHEVVVLAPSHPPGPVFVEVSRDNGRTFTRDCVIFTYYTRNQVEDRLAVVSDQKMSSELSMGSGALPSSVMTDFVS